MSETVCELTELPVSMCSHCRPKLPPVPERTAIVGQLIAARYAGHCGECSELIVEGDLIGCTEDGYWICEHCAEPEIDLRDLIP